MAVLGLAAASSGTSGLNQLVYLSAQFVNVIAHLDDVATKFLILRLIHLRLPRGRSFNNRD
ncbi:hypothetical protein GM539_13325, partial [Streptococcus pneumoniae]|nr:hypothetical protein [Streptococcus pneumoniae]